MSETGLDYGAALAEAQRRGYAEADMLAGEALDEEGKISEATEQFRAAVKANPKEPNAHFGLGYLLRRFLRRVGARLRLLNDELGKRSVLLRRALRCRCLARVLSA